MTDWNTSVVEEFRANGGQVAAFAGAPLLLLHTTGAKTGQPRLHPLMYRALGADWVIFASYAGAEHDPAWYRNLQANPTAQIEVGEEVIDVRARFTEGAERDQIWEQQKQAYPQFAEYEEKTDRTIPVVVLSRS